MNFFVLLVAAGLNIVQFDTYDTEMECRKAALDSVANTSLTIKAMCIDVKNEQILTIVSRGPVN